MLSVGASTVAGQVDAGSISSFVNSRPLLAVGALVGFVLLVGLLVMGVRRLRRAPGPELASLLETHDQVAVMMHPNPDPDAMSAAMAVESMADSVGTDAEVYYPGEIRHQENRAFETVLDLDFTHIESRGDIPDTPIVLVDHNEPRGFAGSEAINPIAVVDHHPGSGEGSEFTDVRTERGACASIFAEYFEDMGWEPGDPDVVESADALPPRIATGLLYGIQSDTKSLTKGCSPGEFEAAAYLYPGVDQDTLDRIANPEVDAEVLDTKATAIFERDVRGAFAVSDVGTVSNVDAIPQAADELLRLEGTTAVVVLGDCEGTLHLSGRSRDDRIHMGKALRAVVEEIPMAGAGGHARMGGGQLSIEHMQGLGPSDGLTREEFRDRLFDAMGGEL